MTRDWFPLILAAAVLGWIALSIAAAAVYDLVARRYKRYGTAVEMNRRVNQ